MGDRATMTGGAAVPALPPTSARASGEAMETAFAPCLALCMRVSRLTVYDMLCLHGKEAPHMASVQCTAVQAHPTEFLDVTSVTRDECQQLVPPVEAVFQVPMAA